MACLENVSSFKVITKAVRCTLSIMAESAVAEEEDMAVAEDGPGLGYRMVEGSLIGHTPGKVFARFLIDGTEETCLSRPNRIYVDGERVKSRDVRTKDRLKSYIDQNLMGKKISMEVVRNTRGSSESVCREYTTLEGETVHPKYYAICIWTGPPPPEDERRPNRPTKTEDSVKTEAVEVSSPQLELDIEGQLGTMVYHNASGQGYIAFIPPTGGPKEHAHFHMRDFFVDGAPIQQKTYHSWPLEKEMAVFFSATRLDTPYVSRFGTANYSCVAAWVGEKPTEDKLRLRTLTLLARSKKANNFDFKIEECEYFAGVMSHFVDARTGIMAAKNGEITLA